MYFISKAANFLLLPPGIFLLLFAAAFILILLRKRKPAAIAAGSALLLFYLFSARFFSDALIRPLEDSSPPFEAGGQAAESGLMAGAPVVVLSGGCIDNSPEEGMGASLNTESEKRLVYGLGLAARLERPLIFSGGSDGSGESEADAARRFIAENPSLAVGRSGRRIAVSYDDRSRTTRENARNVAALAGPAKKIILVTSAYHMRRAALSFHKLGIETVNAPADYKSIRRKVRAADFLPTMAAFMNSYRAVREYIGYLAYSMAG